MFVLYLLLPWHTTRKARLHTGTRTWKKFSQCGVVVCLVFMCSASTLVRTHANKHACTFWLDDTCEFKVGSKISESICVENLLVKHLSYQLRFSFKLRTQILLNILNLRTHAW